MGKLSLQGSFCDTGCNLWWKHSREKKWSRTVTLTLLNVLESIPGSFLPVSLSCFPNTLRPVGFFSFGWEIKVGFASRCEGRVHHLQRIMGFLKKGKAEIPLAGGWGSVSPQWRCMSWEGQWGNVPLCWIWHSAGAFVGELDRNIVLGAWLGLPSLGSSSWLHTSPTRSASFPCTQPCGAVKHHFQRKF